MDMRKQNKTLIWPAYFDVNRTRKRGRRVSKNLAVKSPKIKDLIEVVSKLGFECELIPELKYPKKPWTKTGSLLVEKKYPKEQLLKKIAKELFRLKGRSSRKIKK